MVTPIRNEVWPKATGLLTVPSSGSNGPIRQETNTFLKIETATGISVAPSVLWQPTAASFSLSNSGKLMQIFFARLVILSGYFLKRVRLQSLTSIKL